MKRNILITFLALVFLLAACGEEGIHGKVIDRATGEPLAGATVQITKCGGCPSYLNSTTDEEGKYSLSGVSTGENLISIIWWRNPPDCPDLQPFEAVYSQGDFIITCAGYGVLGGYGNKSILGVAEFEYKEGQSKRFNLKLGCP